MGVTPSSSETQVTRATPARDSAATPKTETRSKFEEAMRRMREGGPHDHQLTGGEGLTPFEQPVLQQHPRSARDERKGGDLAHGSANPAPAQPVPVTTDAMVMSGSPAEIASSHYEFQSRIGLPSQVSGAESQLTMTDQRWLASHAIVRSDAAGGLSVEVQTRSDSDADQQQREALRSRLEARGHRVSSIEISRS